MIGYKEFDFYMEENMNWSSLEMKNMSINGKYISHNNTRYEFQKNKLIKMGISKINGKNNFK